MSFTWIKGLMPMATTDEFLWPGGAGTLFSEGACTMQVKPEGVDDFKDTDITVGTDGGIKNFNLGVGFYIKLSAAGYVSPMRDTKGLAH